MEKVNDLKDIAVISGKPGLFRIVKSARNGVIVEAVGNPKIKLITNSGHKVSILKEISVYTTTGEGAVALEDVFYAVREKYPTSVSLSKEATEAQLREFMDEVLPENDSKRVHISDIKKLISWFNLLAEFFPETLAPKVDTKENGAEKVEKASSEVAKTAEVKAEVVKTEADKVEKKEPKKKGAAKTETPAAETTEVKSDAKSKGKKEKVEEIVGEEVAKKPRSKKA